MSINYPDFEPIDKKHKELFDEAFRKYPPQISEYTFTNIYSWRGDYQFSVSILDEFIILKSGSREKPIFFNPVGEGDKKKVIVKILNDQAASFIRMPEDIAALFKGDNRFSTRLDLDNSDYLYSITDMVDLKGRKHDGKRNLIKNFRDHNKYEYRELTPPDLDACFEFAARWCRIKECDRIESLDREREAVKEMLKNFSEFNLMGGVIKISGRVAALALGEKLNNDTLVMHVLKAEPDIAGSYQTLLNEFLAGYRDILKYVNLEQDLGVAGLRQAKQSYHPILMVNKYIVEKSQNKDEPAN